MFSPHQRLSQCFGVRGVPSGDLVSSWGTQVSRTPFPCSQVLDSLLAQYGTVENCEQGKSG